MNNEYKEKNKKITIAVVCTLTLIAAIAGATYAFFAVNVSSGDYVTGSTGLDENSLKLDIVQLSAGNGKLIPLLDSAIQGAASGTSGNNTCIDNKDNTVCKVYSITITNQSVVKMNVTGNLTLTAADMPNLKWAMGTSGTTGFPTPTNTYYTKTDTYLGDVTLEASGTTGNSKTFYVAIWISEQSSVQTDNGKFTGTVDFAGYIVDDKGNITQGITSAFTG